MREMKDSGIEWIGKIPHGWDIIKTKYIATIIRGGSPRPIDQFYSDDENGYNWIKIGDTDKNSKFITHAQFKIIPAGLTKTRFVKKGTLLLTNSMSFGEPYILDLDGCIHDGWVAFFDYAGIIKEYLYYSLISSSSKHQFEFVSDGGVVQNLNIDKIGSSYICLPSLSEQMIITDYLDNKCDELNSLVSDIQSQIEALEEYKRSVITEAVTKGLDPDVEMKESGIAWVGSIPKHWLVEKVKFHLLRNEPRNPGGKQVLSVYREYGVIPKDSRDDNHNVTSEDTSNYKYVVPGNLVINKMKAWQCSMGISDYEGIVSPAYFIYKFTDNLLLPKYLHYLFRSCYKDEFRRISGGIREGQWDLSPYEFSNTLLLLPPVDEQKRIIDYIDSRIDDIERVIIEKKQQVETIEEYKKSLIFEYVTGKKEVNI